jgi:hypothetical protein
MKDFPSDIYYILPNKHSRNVLVRENEQSLTSFEMDLSVELNLSDLQ